MLLIDCLKKEPNPAQIEVSKSMRRRERCGCVPIYAIKVIDVIEASLLSNLALMSSGVGIPLIVALLLHHKIHGLVDREAARLLPRWELLERFQVFAHDDLCPS